MLKTLLILFSLVGCASQREKDIEELYILKNQKVLNDKYKLIEELDRDVENKTIRSNDPLILTTLSLHDKIKRCLKNSDKLTTKCIEGLKVYELWNKELISRYEFGDGEKTNASYSEITKNKTQYDEIIKDIESITQNDDDKKLIKLFHALVVYEKLYRDSHNERINEIKKSLLDQYETTYQAEVSKLKIERLEQVTAERNDQNNQMANVNNSLGNLNNTLNNIRTQDQLRQMEFRQRELQRQQFNMQQQLYQQRR